MKGIVLVFVWAEAPPKSLYNGKALYQLTLQLQRRVKTELPLPLCSEHDLLLWAQSRLIINAEHHPMAWGNPSHSVEWKCS